MTVQQDQTSGTGSIPATSVTQSSDDSKYLFKKGQEAVKFVKTSATEMYRAVLSGSTTDIANVIDQSQNDNQAYVNFDAKSYTGQFKAPVEAFYATKTHLTK